MAKDKKRSRPYIWVSWLTKLLAGENHCWWAIWYKTHFKYEKTPNDPERESFFKEWTKKHDAITNRRAKELRDQSFTVRVEDDGAFKLAGKRADVAGKPDIVAMKDGRALVVDAKAGKRRGSDHWQVLIYVFSLPLAWLDPKMKLDGEVAYSDGNDTVLPLKPGDTKKIVSAIARVSADEEPSPKPSPFECSRCDIAACTARYVEPEPGDATRFF